MIAITPLAGAFLSPTSADTWVLAAFVLFAAVLVYFGVPGVVARMLDARAERIRGQIAEARSLREDAQRKLADAERKLKDAEAKSREIIERAKVEAKEAADTARKEMEAAVERRIASAHDKIARAEADAVREVRNKAVDAAVGAAAEVMAKGDPGVDAAVSEVASRLAS